MLKRALASSLVVMAAIACIAHGEEPVENIDPARHGNLAAAQRLSREAFDRISAAQDANEFDLGGHAARAKDLLRQANEEIKQAAIFVNRNR